MLYLRGFIFFTIDKKNYLKTPLWCNFFFVWHGERHIPTWRKVVKPNLLSSTFPEVDCLPLSHKLNCHLVLSRCSSIWVGSIALRGFFLARVSLHPVRLFSMILYLILSFCSCPTVCFNCCYTILDYESGKLLGPKFYYFSNARAW